MKTEEPETVEYKVGEVLTIENVGSYVIRRYSKKAVCIKKGLNKSGNGFIAVWIPKAYINYKEFLKPKTHVVSLPEWLIMQSKF